MWQMADEPEVFEKLQGLTWQFLHDGPRTLRATELRLATGRPSLPEQALLRERVRVLHRYGNLTDAHGQAWPPPAAGSADGHLPWPEDGCGSFAAETTSPSVRQRGHGGWQTLKPEANRRWGGGGLCTIRVLSREEWESASPECLGALFTRPFLVAAGGVSALLLLLLRILLQHPCCAILWDRRTGR